MQKSGNRILRELMTLTHLIILMSSEMLLLSGSLQVSIKRARKAHEGEYEPGNYLPISEKALTECMKNY